MDIIAKYVSMYPETLFPIVQRKMKMLCMAMELIGYPLIVTSTVRSCKKQNALYAQGRTTPGNIVTNARCGESYHNWGVAFDVAFLVNGEARWDETLPWRKLGLFGKVLGLEWGGGWVTFVDKPHFQYTAGYSIKDFQQKKVNYNKFL